jgi:hypothetical protein
MANLSNENFGSFFNTFVAASRVSVHFEKEGQVTPTN